MTTTTAPKAAAVRSESYPVTPEHYGENGYPAPNGHVQPPTAAPIKGPALPTFPLEAGWREVYDPATKSYQQQPLTLLDILFPAEGNTDIEVYSLATGERLLTPEELKTLADAETARANAEMVRANAEAVARQAVETELAATLVRLRELEARYQAKSE